MRIEFTSPRSTVPNQILQPSPNGLRQDQPVLERGGESLSAKKVSLPIFGVKPRTDLINAIFSCLNFCCFLFQPSFLLLVQERADLVVDHLVVLVQPSVLTDREHGDDNQARVDETKRQRIES